MSARDQFLHFMKTGQVADYLTVRQTMIDSPNYEPYSDDLNQIVVLVEGKQYQKALNLFRKRLGNLLLSAAAHLMAGESMKGLGQDEEAKSEHFIGRRCIEGILTTGDGSEAEPWLVLRPVDEYDVLGYFGKTMAKQELVKGGRGTCDKMTCTDGSEYWFDVTDAMMRLDQQMEKPRKKWWQVWKR
ncbi:MAG: DUF4919 domain-containing protein [Phycisphaeraceae bacterium]